MIKPHFFLPFPPTPTILYRVLQCTNGPELHSSQVLELVRRRIVDLWDRDTPMFSAPLALVDVGLQCIWLFAVVEGIGQSIEAFLHDGLEEIQQGSYALSELYPCFPSCAPLSKPCENCLPISTGDGTSSLATLFPRHSFRTIHAKFLGALKEHILDRVLAAAALDDEGTLYQKHSTGFLYLPSSKSGEWGTGWEQERDPTTFNSYCVQLHLADGGIIVEISPKLCSFLPLLPSTNPGTPLALLPALVPVYYIASLHGDPRVYGELLRRLKGHGFVAGDAEELAVCWRPLRKSAVQTLIPEQGVYCVWPRSLCVISTSRDPIINMPSSRFVPQPIVKTTNADVLWASLKNGLERSPSVPVARDLGSVTERAGSYIDACMRDRERGREQQKAAGRFVPLPVNLRQPIVSHPSVGVIPSTPTPSQHQLYPSPPGSTTDASQLSATQPPPDAGGSWPAAVAPKSALATSSELHSLRQAATPLLATDRSLFIDEGRQTSCEKDIIVSKRSEWQGSLDPTADYLDDLTLITDDVFNFFDSPPHSTTEAEEANWPPFAIDHPTAVSVDEGAILHPDLPPPLRVSSLGEDAGLVTPKQLADLEATFNVRGGANFGALVYPAHSTTLADQALLQSVPTSDVVKSVCTLRSRYARMTDPRLTLMARLRTLKPSINAAPGHLSGAANSPDLCQVAPDSPGDDGLAYGLELSSRNNDKECEGDDKPQHPTAAITHSTTGDIIPFALLSMPRFISAWLSLHYPKAADLPPNAVEDITTVDGPAPQDALFVLSIPTPVSPEAAIAEDDHENFMRAVLPSFTLEAVDGGVWPRRLLKHRVKDPKDSVHSILGTLRKALGSMVDLASVPSTPDAHTCPTGSVKTLLEPLELPLFCLVQNDNIAHVNPSALRFWSEVGLAPLRGVKDVNAFALFQPGDGCSPAALRSWLQRVTHSYEGMRLGAHIAGQGSSDSDGLVPVRWSNIRHILDVVGSSFEDKADTPLLYLIIPSDFVIVHPMEYANIVEALKDSQRFVHQFVPIDVVHRTSWAEDEIGAFVTSTYDRCKSRLERNVHRREFESLGCDSSWIRCPALTIAQPTTPQFRYSLNWETRGIDTADHQVMLHAGYGFSSSGKWLFSACIDQRGESHCLGCWDVDQLDCGSERDDKVVFTLWNFIKESTRSLSVQWVAAICKLGRLSFAEIKAWDLCLSKNANCGKGLQHVTVMEAGESASFPSPASTLSEQATNEDVHLFAGASPAYAIYSHLRLQLPAMGDAVLVERHNWPEGTDSEDTDSATIMPVHTSFFVYRISGTGTAPPGLGDTDWGALQLNTLLSWTSDLPSNNVWRRTTLDIQREWMSSCNDLAALARERLRDSLERWWPYHLLAIEIMCSASHLLESQKFPETLRSAQQRNAMK